MLRLCFPLSLVMVPTALMAQIAPGSSGTSTQYYFKGQAAWNELSSFGNCYASNERSDALKLVATRPGSVEEAETYKQLFGKANQYCLGSVTTLRASHLMVRGAVAEGLYKKKIPVPANLAVSTGPAVDQVRNLSDAALCYAARRRGEAQSLVEGTKPGTKEEFAAIGALWDGFVECIPSAARKSMQVEATLVRFRIAEALWRLGSAPGQAGRVTEASK